MCGIVGVARMKEKDAVYQRERDIFMQMLQTGLLRGWHGTGAMALEEQGGISALKVSGPPFQFMTSKKFNDFWGGLADTKKGYIKSIIGHNRHATTGEKNSDCAHPFMVKHICLVHNGTLMETSTLPDYKKFKVDSHALTNGIAELGIEKALSETAGAYAIVFFDSKEKTLNLIRNEQRPLFVGVDKFTNRILISSEKEHLSWIMARNQISGGDVSIMELPVDTLWTFDEKNYISPREQKMGGKPWATTAHNGYGEEYAEYMNRGSQSSLITPSDDPGAEFFSRLGPAIKASVVAAMSVIQGAKQPLPALVASPKPRETEFKSNPRLREIYPNPQNYTSSSKLETSMPNDHGGHDYYSICIGDTIKVLLTDIVTDNKTQQKFFLVGATDDIPGARVHFIAQQEKFVDSLFSAECVEVEVCRILVPNKEVEDKEMIIWGKNPKPIAEAIPASAIIH